MLARVLYFRLLNLSNGVLPNYPWAGKQRKKYAGKTVAAKVGPADVRMRITAAGEMEMVGEGSDSPETVSFQIPLALLPRLARGDENAFSAVAFAGDSELAATLSMVARNVEWDVEEDLSRLMGDIAAHRLVGGVKSFGGWARDAETRLVANLAEYLTEERRSFITRRELEELALANETLRDDLARLDARLNSLARPA